MIRNTMRIGVTGHRILERTEHWEWVRREMTGILSAIEPPLTGISSLAIGADQVFAEVVLELGGNLEAVIPFEDYERTFEDPIALARLHRLRAAASRVELLSGARHDAEAYLIAGKRIIQLCQRMLAVWDGMPARGLGGTAQIVSLARSAGVVVIHLNPVECKTEVL